MSRRADYLAALQAAISQARGLGVTLAIEMMAKAMAIPEESFPAVDARDFVQFYDWLKDGSEAPGWVVEAVQNAVSAADSLWVRVKFQGASQQWWREARMVLATESSELPDDIIPLLRGGNGRVKMTRRSWSEVQAWVQEHQHLGAWDSEEPFEEEP
jgi:hypothetical protein